MPEEKNNDVPDIPPHIAARKAIGLTPLGAEQSKSTMVLLGDDGVTDLAAPSRRQKVTPSMEAARQKAQRYAGGTPCRGLSPDQIETITNRDYEDAPKMSFMGDRTQKFVDWIWAKHPWDAKVRYATRLCWPDTLPAFWPPKPPTVALPTIATGMPKMYTEEEARAIVAGKTPRMYSQAEVDAMVAQAQGKQPEAIQPPPPAQKPTTARKPAAVRKPAVIPMSKRVSSTPPAQ